MGGRTVLFLALAGCAGLVRPLEYNITTTWNGGEIDHKPVQLTFTGSEDGKYLDMDISAPFFNDSSKPPGPSGQPFFGLWEYEVVEAFFLNDEDQYLEVEVGPYGHHIVLLLNGQRVTIRHSLPLDVSTEIADNAWSGLARIPVEYLPKNVTRFNAYAIHGSGENRIYESLYPAPPDAQNPDFHALQYFEDIDLSGILPEEVLADMSQFWSDSLEGIFRYHIKTKWNSVPVEHEPVEITLQGFTAGVEMNVTAPFFNDPAPDGKPGEPFYKLWDYEVVEMFFLNDKDEYLEVEVGPFGQHLLLLLKGARNALQHSLPLDYIILEKKDPVDNLPGQWKGSAMLPPGYFPPNVTRMNAYAIHGTDSAREYQSLYPAPNNDPSYPQADFHRLELFRPMDFQFLMPNNSYYSELWQEAIDSGSSAYTFTFRTEEKEETELVTLLGPSFQRDVFPTTIEPTEDVTTLSLEADITTFDPFEDTTTTIEPFEAVTLIGNLEEISRVHEETASSRKPKPQQVFSNEPREQRLEEEPDLLSFQSVSPSEIPRPHLVSDNIRDSNYFLRPFLFLSNFPDEISPFISVQPKFPVVAPQATNQRQPIFPLQQPDDQTQAQFQVPLPPASQYPLQEERFQSIIPGSETSIPGSEPSIPAEEIRSPEPVTNEFNPSISVGVAENVSTEVEHALITLAEDTPALPPPHPVCFEIGLVPDPDCCFVFHECVLEEGEWQMYSWRCRRGQIFDPKHVACKRGRCSREQMRRTRGRCPRVRTY